MEDEGMLPLHHKGHSCLLVTCVTRFVHPASRVHEPGAHPALGVQASALATTSPQFPWILHRHLQVPVLHCLSFRFYTATVITTTLQNSLRCFLANLQQHTSFTMNMMSSWNSALPMNNNKKDFSLFTHSNTVAFNFSKGDGGRKGQERVPSSGSKKPRSSVEGNRLAKWMEEEGSFTFGERWFVARVSGVEVCWEASHDWSYSHLSLLTTVVFSRGSWGGPFPHNFNFIPMVEVLCGRKVVRHGELRV
eukprot:Gb_38959 [translate_table: standard]